MMYVGDQGIYTYTFNLEKKENCAICGTSLQIVDVPIMANLQDLIDILLEKPEMYFRLTSQLKKPSLRTASKTLYMQGFMEEQTRPNLVKLVKEEVGDEEVYVTDSNLPVHLTLRLRYV
jgi:ubiquitin-activating enzyme E1 C